ncbi:MAG: endolytic transglycosylase MltG [Lachnospiraceae bacterium]|nr:endolytic transglycosylase MltG [Lachnospiraceae bacterium]
MRDNLLENISYVFLKVAKFFIKLAIFFVVIYLIGMQLFNFGHRLFYERAVDSENGKEIVFEIKKNETIDEIADNLVKAGLIDDKLAFKFRATIYKTEFNPNIYNLKTSMTIKNMLDIFDSPTTDDIAVTISSEDIFQLSPEDNEPIEESVEE